MSMSSIIRVRFDARIAKVCSAIFALGIIVIATPSAQADVAYRRRPKLQALQAARIKSRRGWEAAERWPLFNPAAHNAHFVALKRLVELAK